MFIIIINYRLREVNKRRKSMRVICYNVKTKTKSSCFGGHRNGEVHTNNRCRHVVDRKFF